MLNSKIVYNLSPRSPEQIKHVSTHVYLKYVQGLERERLEERERERERGERKECRKRSEE